MKQLLNTDKVTDFMRWSKLAFIFSLMMIIASITTISTKGLNWGLDFTGGTLIEVSFKNPADLPLIRESLAESGFGDAIVQNFGTARDVMVRLQPRDGIKGEVLGNQIIDALKTGTGQQVEMRRVEFVGPNVGDELAEAGGLAILIALLCILLYVSVRFEWRLAAGAVLSLAHDIIITVGIFSILQIEVDLTIVAALLTVVGYSLNDTIVVFDRIRENFRKMRKQTAEEIMNSSLSQTLSRTLITSSTTLFVVIALFLKGGAMIQGFALALLLGITIGTYSSIYVASALALKLGITREHLMPTPVEKEGEELDAMP
ncbi:preprotein translocase subunit SecF [Photobacterium iliopiscarium]|jgi:preprotein translocase subunit SecF|uniref:Protein-export membrane protein SecF n=1 Tax=Photobacterium iliopiscarium TaxID=56192 RepID=A0A0D8P113_9GAMM|nr:protein translocase subunit SecF [Photobacterium iliopiscarium]KJG12503.1 preprotein translocase subunit SecF [Photobacterium iliopiscarium]KJG22157.1 preprotein translocase subunit SecF [Photobacterium iliopiscarium]MCD9467544.1 protein translocase subunit SecF [Photobacterium iliopiscarium]MCD9487997.1 protein translocase subunit SecF [Photobacterium iliopiscarium]MCF2243978.1 protein translocase subunit SecF [Photobacterium iliopiscarium]